MYPDNPESARWYVARAVDFLGDVFWFVTHGQLGLAAEAHAEAGQLLDRAARGGRPVSQ